jgi:hypothetical protein
MRRRDLLIALGALAVVGVVCIGIVLFSGSISPAITVRHVSSVRSGSLLTATFQIDNRTSSTIRFSCVIEEIGFVGSARRYQSRVNPGNSVSILTPHSQHSFSCAVTNPPALSALRLSLTASKELNGLETLFGMLRGRRRVPFSIFGKPTTIVSDVFIVPERRLVEPAPSADLVK